MIAGHYPPSGADVQTEGSITARYRYERGLSLDNVRRAVITIIESGNCSVRGGSDIAPVEAGCTGRESLQDAAFERALELGDGCLDTITTVGVAEVEDLRDSAAVVPAQTSIRCGCYSSYPTLSGVRGGIEQHNRLAILENLRIAGSWSGVIGCHRYSFSLEHPTGTAELAYHTL
jgi:hypothetical protein